jgi:predicted HTH domain antitoxin
VSGISPLREPFANRTVSTVDMSTVQVELPVELLELSGTGEVPANAARRIMALELFRERRATLGKAAELAGLSVEQFMDFSARREVPLNYELADLEADRATAKALGL